MTKTCKSIQINVVSESKYTVQGHGVHSVFMDNLAFLQRQSDLVVAENGLHHADVVHVHTVGPVAALAMSFSGQCSVATAHITDESLVGSLVGGKVFSSLTKRYLRWFYSRADLVIALSAVQCKQLRSMGVIGPIEVVPNSAPDRRTRFSRGEARALLGIDENQPVVLSVGQVQPRKAVYAFHRCAEKISDALFVWVGGYPFGRLTADYSDMNHLVAVAPGNVRHVGQLSRDAVQTYYAAADVYFHPSYHENSPVAVLEAATNNLPLVLRDLECYRELYSTHYLAGTELTFAGHIQLLLSDPDLRERMSLQSAEIAAAYSADRVAERLASVYERLVDHR